MQQNHDNNLGSFLENARIDAGLSYRGLAAITRIQRTTIARLCSGRVRRPRAEHLLELARQLEIPSAELFARAGMSIPRSQTPEIVNASLAAHLRAEYELTAEEAVEARQAIVRIIEKHRARRDRTSQQDN